MDNEESLSKIDLLALEILAKSCPRCGGKSANSSNSSGRCRSCLNKLARAKKTPGHWQRAQTKADDALRRQKGKAGGHPTAKGTSRGNGTRKEIVNKIKNAEKKTGQKLSPDRKDNGKGYESSNVRAVPEKLNRGRHNVDEKKLKAWKKRLKKHSSLEKGDVVQFRQPSPKAEQKPNKTLRQRFESLLNNLSFKDSQSKEAPVVQLKPRQKPNLSFEQQQTNRDKYKNTSYTRYAWSRRLDDIVAQHREISKTKTNGPALYKEPSYAEIDRDEEGKYPQQSHNKEYDMSILHVNYHDFPNTEQPFFDHEYGNVEFVPVNSGDEFRKINEAVAQKKIKVLDIRGPFHTKKND